MIYSLIFFSILIFIILMTKRENPTIKEYIRPDNLCDICEGTGNAMSPRSSNIKNRIKCYACGGTGKL